MKEEIERFAEKERYAIDDLLFLMAYLRSEDGCPWDRAQDHASIRKNLIEEAYEVAEAIDRDDPASMREELGDLLLQIVFHAEMEKEIGRFCFEDSVNDICRKLVRRHPHIFAGASYGNREEALRNWEAIKREEKQQTTPSDEMEQVAKTLPSLMRTQKLIRKAEKAGYRGQDGVCAAYLAQSQESAKSAILADLLSICSAANALGMDLEEELYRACEGMIEEAKEKEGANGS